MSAGIAAERGIADDVAPRTQFGAAAPCSRTNHTEVTGSVDRHFFYTLFSDTMYTPTFFGEAKAPQVAPSKFVRVVGRSRTNSATTHSGKRDDRHLMTSIQHQVKFVCRHTLCTTDRYEDPLGNGLHWRTAHHQRCRSPFEERKIRPSHQSLR